MGDQSPTTTLPNTPSTASTERVADILDLELVNPDDLQLLGKYHSATIYPSLLALFNVDYHSLFPQEALAQNWDPVAITAKVQEIIGLLMERVPVTKTPYSRPLTGLSTTEQEQILAQAGSVMVITRNDQTYWDYELGTRNLDQAPPLIRNTVQDLNALTTFLATRTPAGTTPWLRNLSVQETTIIPTHEA